MRDCYTEDKTSKRKASVGGYMVRKMIEKQEKQMSGRQAIFSKKEPAR